MIELPDPEWYLDHVLVHAAPGIGQISMGPAAEWEAWWREQSRQALVRAGVGFVLSMAEFASAGVSVSHVRTRVRRGDWVRAGYGFVAPFDILDDRAHLTLRRRHVLASSAAARRRRDHAVSGRSAAIMYGLPTHRVPERPELTESYSVGLGRSRGPSHVYGATLQRDDRTSWFGCSVTTMPRTLVDLARHDRWDAIMAADAALRERLVTRDEIAGTLARAYGWPGVRQARDVLAIADHRGESALESLTRLRLHDDGFPIPDLQVWIGKDRVDMLFKEQRLVLEIDGLEKYVGDALRREKMRENRLRRLGYRVERVTWHDIVNRWPATSAWLRQLLRLPA